MKLPRYLQVMLLLTAVISLWSALSGDAQEEESLLTVSQPHPVRDIPTTPAPPAIAGNASDDLFPYQGNPVEPASAPATARPEKPRAPQLPFKVVGAWWSNNQRLLVLTDGRESWIVCRQCKLQESIRPGDKLDNNWQLMEIATDSLTFRWLPLKNDQHLSLDDMKSKPEF
ncbi:MULTISPECIES: hypothetical protein [Winslowiella]|uniref:hypothetical protein n=1 Tax=Winslowiella TaxID=2997349 RepID=UPI0028BD7D19|nr:hypothetical protein [Winslowiella toletana]WNN45057.1 hypothetical protein RIN69_03890 [Winslowiella toletana]